MVFTIPVHPLAAVDMITERRVELAQAMGECLTNTPVSSLEVFLLPSPSVSSLEVFFF